MGREAAGPLSGDDTGSGLGLGLMGRRRGRFTRLPMAGGWTSGREMPAPEGNTFFARFAQAQRQGRVS